MVGGGGVVGEVIGEVFWTSCGVNKMRYGMGMKGQRRYLGYLERWGKKVEIDGKWVEDWMSWGI
jgi:hypothetical protein